MVMHQQQGAGYLFLFIMACCFPVQLYGQNATYDENSQRLTLPYVSVPGSAPVSATLNLTNSELWEFTLETLASADETTLTASQGYYSTSNSRLTLPRVDAGGSLFNVELLHILDAAQMTFRLIKATLFQITSTTAQLWGEENQLIEEMLTSSCTLNLGEFYRMYRLTQDGIAYMESGDGLAYTAAVATGIRGAGNTAKHFIRNPSVIRLAENNYVMIYEGMDDEDNPKLFRATSIDGLSFSDFTGPLADGAVIVPNEQENNFMSVPDMVVWNGKLYIYYVANFTEVFYAYSEDEGVTWIKGGRINISGISQGDKYVDPDLVVMPDNSLRLYFACTDQSGHFGDKGILEAASEDGVNFTVTGQVVETSGSQIKLDPDVVERIDQPGKYRVYFGFDETQQNAFALYSALSP